MAGDDETTLLAAGHVKPELLLRRHGEELLGEAGHLGDEFSVNTMVHNLEESPILTGLDNPATNLISAAADLVDAGEGDDGDFIAELIKGNLRTLVFVAQEARLEGVLLREGGESLGWTWSHCFVRNFRNLLFFFFS